MVGKTPVPPHRRGTGRPKERMKHFLEIRSYNLKPGTREEFHRRFIEEAFPLLQRWNVDVVDGLRSLPA